MRLFSSPVRRTRSSRAFATLSAAPIVLKDRNKSFFEDLKEVHGKADMTSEWDVEHLQALRIRFVPAAPELISTKYETVQLSEATLHLLNPSVGSDTTAKSINRWLRVMQRTEYTIDEKGSENEAVVDHFVGEILHTVDIEGDDLFHLVPQRVIRQKIGQLEFVSKPDFVLRDDDELVDLVTHVSKAHGFTQHAWPQIGGEMLLAALANMRIEGYS